MHGPTWGSREEELLREYKALIERAAKLATEIYVLRWLLAEAQTELANAHESSMNLESRREHAAAL